MARYEIIPSVIDLSIKDFNTVVTLHGIKIYRENYQISFYNLSAFVFYFNNEMWEKI